MQCLKKLFQVVENKAQYYNRINLIHRKGERTVLNLIHRFKHDFIQEFEGYEESEEEKHTYKEISEDYLGKILDGHRVFIIQPYIKWGFRKKRNTTPDLQLAEAVALVNTLPNWSVVGKKIVPLLTLQRNQLVGSGALETLKGEIRGCPGVTAVFVSTNLLKFVQIAILQKAFGLPIYDRYTVVIHIFHKHAKTAEAKLQVAIAEIPYIKKKMIDLAESNIGRTRIDDKTKELLETREKKLKNALQNLKEHRKLMKRQRQSYGFPTIAVVGYTNAGKTSLIKALTGDSSMEPKDKLFATLDTTVHQGYLPNKLKVLYIDTIGFIQDVPETLIEPFKVTLEDAIDANIIVHVYDMSHPDVNAQIQHIQKMLEPMIDKNKIIINVANKCDIVDKNSLEKETLPEDTYPISALKSIGTDLLRFKIEEEILKAANLITKRFKVPVGGHVATWLYKETTVTDAEPDSEDPQYLIMNVIMTTSAFYRLKRFCKQ
ncbi:PREDICTED: putative GTP-binding protein 6 [Dufourea novaeangliae]|uniref:Putative GTP-binding protein 6 n=1 Tax=Dufourea novaeangliae TaxID=178035 RepID=A0A154NWQ6_DUFNO|nr:PREDICTED: putative GTP-binding protein 6 [Dufourea novaeangliae]KZC04125.1 Putative GTP-binding protein 6 [Dufourea novaeangliae]